MDLPQGQYVMACDHATDDTVTGFFVGEYRENYLVEVESEGDICLGWERDNVVPEDYSPRGSDMYIIAHEAIKHCSERHGTCYKCRFSTSPNIMFIDENTGTGDSISVHGTSGGSEFGWGNAPSSQTASEAIKTDNVWSTGYKDVDHCDQLGSDINSYSYYFNSFMDSLRQIPKMLKKALKKNLQKMYRARLIDDDLELTSKGKEELMYILQDEYEEDLADRAEEIIEEKENE